MGRLFWKIFLWFWLAMILTNLSVAWVLTQFLLSADNKLTARLIPKMALPILATTAVLEHSGDAATKELLKDLSGLSRFKIFVIDDQGRELLGRPLPEPGAVETETDTSKTLKNRSHGRSGIVAEREVVSPEGDRYTIIVESPAVRSPFGILRYAKPFTLPPPLRRDPRLLFLRLGIAILLSGMVCFWLAWYLARPIRRLREASRRLADGDLSVRVSRVIGRRRDEIANLGRDFDHMAERLQSIISRQKQLIRDISHELRSPLARLHVAMGLARKKFGGSAERELDRIEREADRLESLVAQILMLAGLEESKADALQESIDIAVLLRSIVDDAEYEAVNRHCHVLLECRAQPILKGNGELLHRALENVIRNAVKYTAESTTVDVIMQASSQQGDWVEILVCDHGHGVPEEQLPNLFQPFVRVIESRCRNSGGYGLGLTIAQRAIRLHGGHISARNRKNIGLCVEIRLPLHAGINCKGNSE